MGHSGIEVSTFHNYFQIRNNKKACTVNNVVEGCDFNLDIKLAHSSPRTF